MQEFINKMLELGAELELSCSDAERIKVVKKAEALYSEHIEHLKTQIKVISIKQ